jgi:hypothetical protein
MQPTEPVEFSRPLQLDRISTTQHREEVTATDKERADLAKRFDLLSLDSLTASFTLKRVRKDLVRVKGHVTAELAQACVVTLDPVPAKIDERFEVDFLEGVQAAVTDLELDAEAAEALGEGHERAQLRHPGRVAHGDVDGMLDQIAIPEGDDLASDIDGHVDLCLAGVGAEMRGHHHRGMADEPA